MLMDPAKDPYKGKPAMKASQKVSEHRRSLGRALFLHILCLCVSSGHQFAITGRRHRAVVCALALGLTQGEALVTLQSAPVIFTPTVTITKTSRMLSNTVSLPVLPAPI